MDIRAEVGALNQERQQASTASASFDQTLTRGRRAIGLMPLLLSLGLVLLIGCHASPDDPGGQAKELSDSVRRENAVYNIGQVFAKALSASGGDRSKPEVKAVIDSTVTQLAEAYVNNPEDRTNGLAILDVLKDMRDARAMPALLEALKWRTEVSEDHAIRAAQTLAAVEIPPTDRAKVVDALSKALGLVKNERTVDNKMRIEFIRALGGVHDKSATPMLAEIATSRDPKQNFLINRLAAQQLGELQDPAAIPSLIKALFLFAPGHPEMRMNDVAAEALIRIGRPSLKPLLQVLDGTHAEANQIAEAYIREVRAQRPDLASQMNVSEITSAEATFALGALGFPEAFDSLRRKAQSDDDIERLNGTIALIRLTVSSEQRAEVRNLVKATYARAAKNIPQRGQLIGVMAHSYDAEFLSTLLSDMSSKTLHPDLRLLAADYYSVLANKEEANRMRSAIAAEEKSEDGGYREKLNEHAVKLDLAAECDTKVACWASKVGSKEGQVARKAVYMLGRYGGGNAEATKALVQGLDSRDLAIRMGALFAIDHVAVNGSPEAVAKIDYIAEHEAGQSSWTHFRGEALPIQARLRSRR